MGRLVLLLLITQLLVNPAFYIGDLVKIIYPPGFFVAEFLLVIPANFISFYLCSFADLLVKGIRELIKVIFGIIANYLYCTCCTFVPGYPLSFIDAAIQPYAYFLLAESACRPPVIYSIHRYTLYLFIFLGLYPLRPRGI